VKAVTQIERSDSSGTTHPGLYALWHWQRLLLVAILALAAGLRFGGITRVGLRFDDEFAYAADAGMWHHLACALCDRETLQAAWAGDQATLEECLQAHGVDFKDRYTKPCQGYTLLAAGMMFITGDRPEALLILNALCGTLAVLVLYQLARLVSGRGTALTAALILAVTPYHLVYCRSALAESSAVLFILTGVWLWMKAFGLQRRKGLCQGLAGAALGVAVTCHYKSLYVIAIVILFEIGMRLAEFKAHRGLRLKRLASSLVPFVFGFMLPLLMMEGLLRSLRWGAGTVGVHLPLATLFEAYLFYAGVIRSVTAHLQASGFPQPDVPPLALCRFYVHWHGIAAGLLTLFGLVILLRFRSSIGAAGVGDAGPPKVEPPVLVGQRRSFDCQAFRRSRIAQHTHCSAEVLATLPAFIILGTLVFYAFQPYALPRMFTPALPFACLCLAVGICSIVVALRRRRVLQTAVTVLLVASLARPALSATIGLLAKQSHLEHACAYLASQGAGKAAVPESSLGYRKYLHRSPIDLVPLSGSQAARSSLSPAQVLDRLEQQGVRWVIIDPTIWVRPVGSPQLTWWLAVEQELLHRAKLMASFPHISDYRWEFLSEAGLLESLPEMERRNGGEVCIYEFPDHSDSRPQMAAKVLDVEPTGTQ
jgi:4-amino-4-deoxy-L-arabinose transferase-like glycosyltransferase